MALPLTYSSPESRKPSTSGVGGVENKFLVRRSNEFFPNWTKICCLRHVGSVTSESKTSKTHPEPNTSIIHAKIHSGIHSGQHPVVGCWSVIRDIKEKWKYQTLSFVASLWKKLGNSKPVALITSLTFKSI